MDFKQFVVLDRPGDFNFMDIQPLLSSTVSDRPFAPGIFDEDSPHGFGGGGEEVGAILPFLALGAAKSKPGLVNKRRGLKSLSGRLVRQSGSGKPAQFIVKFWQEIFSRLRLAFFQFPENLRVRIHLQTQIILEADSLRWKKSKKIWPALTGR